MITHQKLRVSERGILQRINRLLADRNTNHVMKKARMFARPQVGVYYLLDTEAGRIVEHNVNLERFGRKLGVMHAWEVLVRGDLND